MFQRLQTLLLFLCFLTLMAMFFLPLVVYSDESGNIYKLYAHGFFITSPVHNLRVIAWPILSIMIIILIVNIYTITLYRDRKLQRKLATMNGFFCYILIGGTFLYSYIGLLNGKADPEYKISFLFPVIASLLYWYAARRIKKDDEIIKSYERIR